jgi:hypothetical protein
MGIPVRDGTIEDRPELGVLAHLGIEAVDEKADGRLGDLVERRRLLGCATGAAGGAEPERGLAMAVHGDSLEH